MKIITIDDAIEEFRNGKNVWSKASIELFVREIERLRKKLTVANQDADRLAEQLEREQNPGYRCWELKEHDIRLKESEGE